MLISCAHVSCSRTFNVLGSFAYACRLWLEALAVALRFDGVSFVGLMLMKYPSWTLFRAWLLILVGDGLFPDYMVTFSSTSGLARFTRIREAAHTDSNLAGF